MCTYISLFLCKCLCLNIRSVCFYLYCTFIPFYVPQTTIFHTLVCANGNVHNDRVCASCLLCLYADSPKGTDVFTFITKSLYRFSSWCIVECSLCVWSTNSGNLGTFYIFLNAKTLLSLFFPLDCHIRHFSIFNLSFSIICVF